MTFLTSKNPGRTPTVKSNSFAILVKFRRGEELVKAVFIYFMDKISSWAMHALREICKIRNRQD